MSTIFSTRFLLAIGALALLVAAWMTAFRPAVEESIAAAPVTPGRTYHTIDLIDRIGRSSNARFRVRDGVAAVDTTLTLTDERRLLIVAGTPGELRCPDLGRVDRCVVAADLIGEAVVWFSIVPHEGGPTVVLPAIDTLADGLATLTNGWRVAFAPVLDRRCESEFVSYNEFRNQVGTEFDSIYDVREQRLIAVVCHDLETDADTSPTTLPPWRWG